MHRALTNRRWRFASLAVIAVLIAGALATVRLARGDDEWTFEGEHVATVREVGSGTGGNLLAETRSTARIWFQPGAGWRMEVESDGTHGREHRILGSDGVTVWVFDPDTNRYTSGPDEVAAHDPALVDPRATLAVMMATAGTRDFAAALVALRELAERAGRTVTEEGEETVAGRLARIIVTTPYRCSSSSSATTGNPAAGVPSGSSTPPVEECSGSVRSSLDARTGWVLRSEAEDGHGGGYRWETRAADFDARIDAALFHFTPLPGSIRVDRLE